MIHVAFTNHPTETMPNLNNEYEVTSESDDLGDVELVPSTPSLYVAVPATEAEAHLDVVWEDWKTNLNAIACVDVQSQVPERRVQGDIFHMMRRPRPAAKHSYLHLYAEALSYAFLFATPRMSIKCDVR